MDLKKYFYLLIIVSLTGCSSIGPKQINTDRSAYNEIVSQTNHEQLLANIVRSAYAEPASYLQITSVTASYSVNRSFSITPGWSGSYTTDANPTTTLSGSAAPSISYSDSPTISYMPLDDATFVRMMQRPLGFDDIDLLMHEGHNNINYLGKLLFFSIGPLDNAAYAANPRNIIPPAYKDFYRFVEILGEMQQKHTAEIIPTIFQEQPGLAIEFTQSSTSAQAMLLKKLARVPLNSKNIVLVGSVARSDNFKVDPSSQLIESSASSLPKNLVYVKMKSIHGILAFLSHAVQIPEADRKANFTYTLMDNGQPYDWAPLMHDLMTVYSSEE